MTQPAAVPDISTLLSGNGRTAFEMWWHTRRTRFRLSTKRTSPFKSTGASVQSTTGSRGVRISGSNAGYTMFRGSVKCTGCPLHSPVSLSLRLSCVTVCHYISTGFYLCNYQRPCSVLKMITLTEFSLFSLHHHHAHEGLGVFPVPWSSKWNWSLHLFLGRPTFLRPVGLYCNACFGILFVSILCTCCSHFSLVLFYFLYYVLRSCFFP